MLRRLVVCSALVLWLAVPPLALAEDFPAAGPGTRAWIGRWSDYEDCLRTAPIERIEDVGQGSGLPALREEDHGPPSRERIPTSVGLVQAARGSCRASGH